jgi:hypothetical protein
MEWLMRRDTFDAMSVGEKDRETEWEGGTQSKVRALVL